VRLGFGNPQFTGSDEIARKPVSQQGRLNDGIIDRELLDWKKSPTPVKGIGRMGFNCISRS
jgi:hypothetical protein